MRLCLALSPNEVLPSCLVQSCPLAIRSLSSRARHFAIEVLQGRKGERVRKCDGRRRGADEGEGEDLSEARILVVGRTVERKWKRIRTWTLARASMSIADLFHKSKNDEDKLQPEPKPV